MIQSKQVSGGMHSKCDRCGFERVEEETVKACPTCGTLIEAMVRLIYANAEQILAPNSGFVSFGYSRKNFDVSIKLQEYIPEVSSIHHLPKSVLPTTAAKVIEKEQRSPKRYQ